MENHKRHDDAENYKTSANAILKLEPDTPLCTYISAVLWGDGISDIERKTKISEALADACGRAYGINKPFEPDETEEQDSVQPSAADKATEEVVPPSETDDSTYTPRFTPPEGINPVLVKYALYYDHNELLQRLIDTVRSPGGMRQVILFNEQIKISPYRDRSIRISLRNRDIELSFYRHRPRAGQPEHFQALLDRTAEKVRRTAE